jgi:transposase
VPIAGAFGRASRRLELEVVPRASRAELVDGFLLPRTAPGAMIYTDDWVAYAALPRRGRGHAAVNHLHYEWARDDDGDGVREVHCNALEGIWTGLREYLRPFRGVHKRYLAQYVAMFGWAFRLKAVTDGFLRILLGSEPGTVPGS